MSIHAYWIHKKVESKKFVKGWYWERQCTCSSCGFQANMEKDICPRCGAIMDAKEPDGGAQKPANVTSRQEMITAMLEEIHHMPEGTATSTFDLVTKLAGRNAERAYGQMTLLAMDNELRRKAKDDIVPEISEKNSSLPYTSRFIIRRH